MVRRHELTDQEWELLAPLIPRAATGQQMRGGPAGHQRHGLQDPHTGISWRDLPEHHGPWKTVYTRFRRDALDGCSPNLCSSSRSMPTQLATSTGWSGSTPPSSVPTSTPPPPAEKGGAPAGRTGRSRPRPIPRRTDHQNPPRLRRQGPPARWNGSASPAPARTDLGAGPTRSSQTRPAAPAASAPTCENASLPTPSEKADQRRHRLRRACHGGDRQDSTGRPTGGPT